MGNAQGGLPYEILEQIEPYNGNKHWQVHLGIKKEDLQKEDKDYYSIFRFLKTNQLDKLAVAQRNWQKLRSIKHPFIVSYVDGIELDDAIVIITEHVSPLEKWLQQINITPQSTNEDKENLTQEIIWGLKCLLEALCFLHNNCNVIHGYLGLHSCFIAKNGDWKLGALDLASNIHDDESFFQSYEHLQGKPFRSPERVNGKWSTVFTKATSTTTSSSSCSQSAIDMYSFGHIVQQIFQLTGLSLPEALDQSIIKVLKPDPKRRVTAPQLLQNAAFSTDNITLMTSLGELTLKPPHESIEILNKLAGRAGGIPKSVCTHKILPTVARSLQIAAMDFSNRDSRETCRLIVQFSLSLLSQLAEQSKIEDSHFVTKIVPPLLQLWSMSDRAVRTSLLKSLKSLTPLLPTDIINKKIFDPLLSGFADSNCKMREESLKSLVPLIDRLQEKQLQDQLVRCVCTLQSDPEASIRTNATIFLGRIANKLNNTVRAKVLCGSYAKAMKDVFVPCRIAGLRATLVCLAIPGCLEPQQIATKLMPQVCVILIDPSSEVRELALDCLSHCHTHLKEYHQKQIEVENKEKEKLTSNLEHQHHSSSATSKHISSNTSNSTSSNVPSNSSSAAPSVFGTWAPLTFSWAVEGLAKSLTLDNKVEGASGNSSNNERGPDEEEELNSGGSNRRPYSAPPSTGTTTAASKPMSTSTQVKSTTSTSSSSSSRLTATPTSVTSTTTAKASIPATKKVSTMKVDEEDEGWDLDMSLDDFDLDADAEVDAMNLDIDLDEGDPWGDEFEDTDKKSPKKSTTTSVNANATATSGGVKGISSLSSTRDKPSSTTATIANNTNLSGSSTGTLSINKSSSNTTKTTPANVPSVTRQPVYRDRDRDDFFSDASVTMTATAASSTSSHSIDTSKNKAKLPGETLKKESGSSSTSASASSRQGGGLTDNISTRNSKPITANTTTASNMPSSTSTIDDSIGRKKSDSIMKATKPPATTAATSEPVVEKKKGKKTAVTKLAVDSNEKWEDF